MKLVGEKILAPYIESLDNIRQEKVLNWISFYYFKLFIYYLFYDLLLKNDTSCEILRNLFLQICKHGASLHT